MLDLERLRIAYETARQTLLAERTPAGHWVGELSSSALSTATAVSAIAIVAARLPHIERTAYELLIDGGIRWILSRQNADGGWGDTDKSLSNISTTMLVQAALHLAGRAERNADALQKAEAYVQAQGGIAGLRRRYGKDKTFAVPILTNCALAGLVSWKEVSPLPFELACLPPEWYRFARMPVVSYAIPALVAIGQARYHFAPPWNPLMRFVRGAAVEKSLEVLQKMQPASGGFLEATPLTSFVVMSLASIGRHDHAVTRSGLRFLVDSVRGDGSWPIDTNLATWVTTLAINALGPEHAGERYLTDELREWVLSCQHRERHPYTDADPGGWGWSDLSGAVPDADDTPGALLALRHFQAPPVVEELGRTWLRNLQNGDGGWPTFCRGWGKLPFDRSGSDLTAHAIRALRNDPQSERARTRGLRYLAKQQRRDGSWLPLWFGNQFRPDDENPLYGTARVLAVYRDLGRTDDPAFRRGVDFLLSQQNADGGWGGGEEMGSGEWQMGNAAERGRRKAESGIEFNPQSAIRNPKSDSLPAPHSPLPTSSTEETALVVGALCAAWERPEVRSASETGANWLVQAVESGRFRRPSPIGFYFAKLWYHEKLYPIIFTVEALRATMEASEYHRL